MAVLFDARANEFQGSLDQIGGATVTDARTASATLSALNAELLMDINGKAVAVFDLRPTNFTGTLIFEGTIDGANYFQLSHPLVVFTASSVAVPVRMPCVGWRRVRCRVSTAPTNSIVVTGRATDADEITSSPIPFLGGGAYKAAIANIDHITVAVGAANAETLQFRNPSTTKLAIVQKVVLTSMVATTGFTAATFMPYTMTIARAWTADGAAGTVLTLTGNNNKLRTGHETCAATIRSTPAVAPGLTAGTKTLDANPIGVTSVILPATAIVVTPNPVVLFDSTVSGAHQCVLGLQEGFVIRHSNVYPAAGAVAVACEITWTEALSY